MTTKSKSAANPRSAKPRRPTAEQTRRGAQRQKGSPPTADRLVAARKTTKTEKLLVLLGRRDGATIEELMAATGWQAHSVRGFLAGTAKKTLGLAVTTTKSGDGIRRYRVMEAAEQ
jgi:Protein of unknown function (DUF3489)